MNEPKFFAGGIPAPARQRIETDSDVLAIIDRDYTGTTRDAMRGLFQCFRDLYTHKTSTAVWLRTLDHVIALHGREATK